MTYKSILAISFIVSTAHAELENIDGLGREYSDCAALFTLFHEAVKDDLRKKLYYTKFNYHYSFAYVAYSDEEKTKKEVLQSFKQHAIKLHELKSEERQKYLKDFEQKCNKLEIETSLNILKLEKEENEAKQNR